MDDGPATPFAPTPDLTSHSLTTTTPQMPQQQAHASYDSTSAVTGNRVAVRLHTPASAAIPQAYMQPAVGSTMAAAEKRQSNPSASPAVPGSNAGQHTMLLPLDRCQCGEAAGSVHRCDGCGRNMHVFCGKPIGPEGYGQSSRCKWCVDQMGLPADV